MYGGSKSRRTAAELFNQYQDHAAIRKAECYAQYTLPYLMIDPNITARDGRQDTLEHDYQSIGADLVNTLASKLTQNLFPVGIANFKINIDNELREMAAELGVDQDSQLEASLNSIADEAAKQPLLSGGYHKLNKVAQLLIVTGNALLYRDRNTDRYRVWNMHSYAVRRDSDGNVQCVVLKENIMALDLPQDILNEMTMKGRRYMPEDVIDVYTKIITTGRTTYVQQEVDSHLVGNVATYPAHLSPWIVPTWNLGEGENYGRGHVEDYAGAFARLSLLSEKLGAYELESLELLNMVDPAAGANIDDLNESQTGDYIPAKAGLITAYERGDYNKISTIANNIQLLKQDLAKAFMYTAQQRDAERVTAEEVQRVAIEAESALGGVYSLLEYSLLTPIAYQSMLEVVEDDDELLQALILEKFKPSLTVGVAAITRSADTTNLLRAVQEAGVIVPAIAQLSQKYDPELIFDQILIKNGVNIEKIMKSPEKLEAEAAAKREAANAMNAQANALQTGDAQGAIEGVLNG